MDARLTFLDLQKNKLQSVIYNVPQDLNLVVFKMFKEITRNDSIVADLFMKTLKEPSIPCHPKTVYLLINDVEYELVSCDVNRTLDVIKFYTLKQSTENKLNTLNTVVPLNINIQNGGSLLIEEVSENNG